MAIIVETSTDLIVLEIEDISVDVIDFSSYGLECTVDDSLEREAFIQHMPTEEIPLLTINHKKGHHQKRSVIEYFVKHVVVSRLRSSLNNADIRDLATEKRLRLTGYAVVVVGSRQVLATRLSRCGKGWKTGSTAATNQHTEMAL